MTEPLTLGICTNSWWLAPELSSIVGLPVDVYRKLDNFLVWKNSCLWCQKCCMGKKQILRVEEHYKVRCRCLVTKFCPNILQTCGLEPARLLCPWDFPGKNTGMGFHFLLQEIFPTQGMNPCLLYWQVDSLPLSHQGNSIIRLSNTYLPDVSTQVVQ